MLMMVRVRVAIAYFAEMASQTQLRESLVALDIAPGRFVFEPNWLNQTAVLPAHQGQETALSVVLTPQDEPAILARLLASDALRVEIHDIEA